MQILEPKHAEPNDEEQRGRKKCEVSKLQVGVFRAQYCSDGCGYQKKEN